LLPVGLLAVGQATSLLVYLPAELSTFINPQGSDTITLTYILVPLVLFAATIAVLFYSVWLWRRGVLG
jgi:hypothetical protein